MRWRRSSAARVDLCEMRTPSPTRMIQAMSEIVNAAGPKYQPRSGAANEMSASD
jgi:hypothetical protein